MDKLKDIDIYCPTCGGDSNDEYVKKFECKPNNSNQVILYCRNCEKWFIIKQVTPIFEIENILNKIKITLE